MAHGFGDVARLCGVELHGLPLVDGAEAAVARAGVTAEHEGRGSVRPALEDVRAARLLADRVPIRRVRLRDGKRERARRLDARAVGDGRRRWDAHALAREK